ncbi:hypothetical protein D3C84_234200 [compost metagenome]
MAEHQDRLHDVMIDDVALFTGQSAFGDAQVVQLTAIVFVRWHVEFESPGVVCRNQFGVVAFEQMLGSIRQQRLADGEFRGRGACLAVVLFPGNTQSIIQCPGPGSLGDAVQSLQVCIGHGFAPQVAASDEGEIVIKGGQAGITCFTQEWLLTAQGKCMPVVDPGIALEDFEARADLVDAVVEGFQLGGFVDHVFRGGDFAAVVQPGGDMQGFPLVVGRLVGHELRGLARGSGLGEHQGQCRDALAVATGIGALGVNRAGQ